MVNELTRSAVRIYGALSGLGNGSGNVMESIIPFFEPILRPYDGRKLDPNQIAQDIRATYKWNFNADIVEAFAPYLQRQGWIHADIQTNVDTTYTISMGGNNSASSVYPVESELRRIAQEFKAFSESLSPLTAIPREVEEFEDILVEWLLYIEAFSEGSIDFTVSTRTDENGKLTQRVDVPRTTSLKDEEQFLCARFVQHAVESNEKTAEILSKIAAIGLLTEVVQDFVKPITAVESTNLIVYFDAPVAMELIGVSGTASQQNTEPVVSELRRMGASVQIFGQSIEEIKHSLQAVLRNPRPTGPTAQAMIRREVIREFVASVSQNPVPFLEKYGVQPTYRSIDQTPSDHKYFTNEQRTDLYGRLRYAENPHARDHDADITTLAIRQRHGRTSTDIFRSHVVVITRNGLLAQIVRKMMLEAGNFGDVMVPPVVHRRAMATSMWLRTGLGASDLNIPKRMLLASCERVLAIRPNVVEAVTRLTAAAGDEQKLQQLDLLISQDRSAQALMDKTLGLTNVVTAENLPLLWEEMLHPHLEGERERGRAAVAAEKVESRRKIGELRDRMEATIKDKEQREQALREALDRQIQEDRSAVDVLAGEVAKRLMWYRWARHLLAIVLGLAFSVPLLMETTTVVRLASFLIGSVLAYLTATGGRLVGLGTSEQAAFQSLRKAAHARGISSKLERFVPQWDGKKFRIEEAKSIDVQSPPTSLL